MNTNTLDQCPVCEADSGIDGWETEPEAGEIVLCSSCASILMFDDELDLVYITPEMMEDMSDDMREGIEQMQEIIHIEGLKTLH